MSLARRCDRCGNFYDPKSICIHNSECKTNAIRTINRDFKGGYSTADTYDLCIDCLISLNYWFNNPKEK